MRAISHSICSAGLPRKGRIITFLLFVTLVFCSFQPGGESEEYKLKAVFLYNFTQYVDWDPATISDQFIIGTLGSSPIDEQLEEIARAKTFNGKKIVVRHFRSVDDITPCNILFISRDVRGPLSAILAKVPKGTLTVGERESYNGNCTAINFIIVDNKLKFEASRKAISTAGLKVSSQLLKLAKMVD